MTDILIHSETIKLDAFLKFCSACSTGGEAKHVIQEGLVMVNGTPCSMRGKKLTHGDCVQFDNETYQIVREASK